MMANIIITIMITVFYIHMLEISYLGISAQFDDKYIFMNNLTGVSK